MAKFQGFIGYITDTEETEPGVYEEVITERRCRGDILRNSQRWESSDQINDDITINNRFSMVGDPFAYSNIPNMRYLKWNDIKWKITSVDIQRPRLILHVGGEYNE